MVNLQQKSVETLLWEIAESNRENFRVIFNALDDYRTKLVECVADGVLKDEGKGDIALLLDEIETLNCISGALVRGYASPVTD